MMSFGIPMITAGIFGLGLIIFMVWYSNRRTSA